MTCIALDIMPLLDECDHGSPLTVRVGGLPAGASLSSGTPCADGCWEIAGVAIGRVMLTLPWSCRATALYLDVRANWREIFNGSEVESEQTLRLRVELPEVMGLDFSRLAPRWGAAVPYAGC